MTFGRSICKTNKTKKANRTNKTNKTETGTAVMAHRALAVGFLRSYARLVASPLDFALAKEAHLLPDDGGNNSFDWLAWAAFIQHFRRLGDEHVAPRYHYGQLRLSRLN